jgi:hypothetical protein
MPTQSQEGLSDSPYAPKTAQLCHDLGEIMLQHWTMVGRGHADPVQARSSDRLGTTVTT